MKTLKELFDAISADEKLNTAFFEAVKADQIEAFLKENGCDATKEELKAYMQEEADKARSLSPEDLARIAGGTDTIPLDIATSILPWECNPNYSSMIDPITGKVNIILVCA